jgi:hypothetical protein
LSSSDERRRVRLNSAALSAELGNVAEFGLHFVSSNGSSDYVNVNRYNAAPRTGGGAQPIERNGAAKVA